MIDPNSYLMAYYTEYRAKGYTGAEALSAARIKDRFTDLEAEALVEFHAVPEDISYEDGVDEDPHLSDQAKAYHKAEVARLIDRKGYWIWSARWRLHDTGEWEYADNIGGIIGNDLSGYDVELMRSAIEAYEGSLASQVSEYSNVSTYAGV